MKRLLVIRHAKSSWDNSSQTDFERTLNERGKKDAPEMAARLNKKNIIIDVFISSMAVRAKTTAIILLENLQNKNAIVEFHNELYLAPESVFYSIIEKINNAYATAAIVAHNPGITNFVNLLNVGIKTDNVPTCGIFAIEADVNNWYQFQEASKRFLFFDYPKLIS